MWLFPAGAVTESLLCSSPLGNSLESDYLKEASSLDKKREFHIVRVAGFCSREFLPFSAPEACLCLPTVCRCLDSLGPSPGLWFPGGGVAPLLSHPRVPPFFQERRLCKPHSPLLLTAHPAPAFFPGLLQHLWCQKVLGGLCLLLAP